MRMTLLGSTAVALVLALAPAYAQSQQQKGSEEKSAPQATEKNTPKEFAEPKGSKGSAQHESKGNKGAEQAQQSKDKEPRGRLKVHPRRRVPRVPLRPSPRTRAPRVLLSSVAGEGHQGYRRDRTQGAGRQRQRPDPA